MVYSSKSNSEIEYYIDQILDRVRLATKAMMGDDLMCLVLYGSLARGEASIGEFREGPRLLSDIDIIAGTRGLFPALYFRYQRRLEKEAKRIAACFDGRLIEIVLRDVASLYRRDSVNVYRYEIGENNRVLYCRPGFTFRIPRYDPRKIPLSDGTTFFLKRGCGLLIAGMYILSGRKLSADEIERCIIEIEKAVIAVGDCMLLERGRYHWSLRERWCRICSKCDGGTGDELWSLYHECAQNRLEPLQERYSRERLEFLWWKGLKVFQEYFRGFETSWYGDGVLDWIGYSERRFAETAPWKEYIRNIVQTVLAEPGHIFRPRRCLRSSRLRLRSAMLGLLPLILFAVTKEGLDMKMLERAVYLLGLDGCGSPADIWRLAAGKWLMLFSVFPNRIVSDVLTEQCRWSTEGRLS